MSSQFLGPVRVRIPSQVASSFARGGSAREGSQWAPVRAVFVLEFHCYKYCISVDPMVGRLVCTMFIFIDFSEQSLRPCQRETEINGKVHLTPFTLRLKQGLCLALHFYFLPLSPLQCMVQQLQNICHFLITILNCFPPSYVHALLHTGA